MGASSTTSKRMGTWVGLLACVVNLVLIEAKLLRSVLTKDGLDGLLEQNDKNNTIPDTGDEISDGIFSQPVYIYVLIPIISGLIGYITNVIALKMTFYPLEFVPNKLEFKRFKNQPIGLFGWQGIIPTKAAKMAAQSCDIMTEKLFNMKDLFTRIDEKEASAVIKPGFTTALDRIIDDLSDQFLIDTNTNWTRTQTSVKAQVREWAIQELPAFTEGFMRDLVDNLDDCYDLKHMIVSEMTAHKEILVDLFITVGQKELKFIERSGLYFGFAFGLVQMLVYGCYEAAWVLPVFGFIVGFATNMIALKMIFAPIEPTLICGRYWMHGVFLKRQQEASAVFATKMVESVLHSRNIWHYMITGPKNKGFETILRSHADAFTDRMIGYLRPLVQMWIGAEDFTQMKQKVQDETVKEIASIVQFMHDYTNDALDLETELRVKMQALPSREFERVLHPVFEEDEVKLFFVGAFLGAAVGGIQAALI